MTVEKLRKLVQADKKSQNQLSKEFGMLPSTFSRKIRGQKIIMLDEAKAFADYFGMTIEELFFN